MTKDQTAALNLLIKRVRLEKACITFTAEQRQAIGERRMNGPFALGTKDGDTGEIREALQRYTETWIVPLLEAIRDGQCEDGSKLHEILPQDLRA